MFTLGYVEAPMVKDSGIVMVIQKYIGNTFKLMLHKVSARKE